MSEPTRPMISDDKRREFAANLRESREFISGLLKVQLGQNAFDAFEGIPAPVDADGEPIRIGDVLYSRGNKCRVVSITVKADEVCVGVHTDEGVFLPSVNPKYLSHKNPEPLEPEPADSWERLEEDIESMLRKNLACYYFGHGQGIFCCACPVSNLEKPCKEVATCDILRRIKALAGSGDGE